MITDKMVEAAAIAVHAKRNPYITPQSEGPDYNPEMLKEFA